MPDLKPPLEEIADPTGDDKSVAVEPAFQQPGLLLSLTPIVLPIVLITLNTFFNQDPPDPDPSALGLIGNPNFALLVSAAIALWTMWVYRKPTIHEFATGVEQALMSGGVIVLITCAGGAFGGMLKAAGLAPAIEMVFGESTAAGFGLLFLAFFVATLLKFAQGSSTAAMIVSSGMIAAIIAPEDSETGKHVIDSAAQAASLGFHPVYLATAIGAGSLVGSWMNDSGFWIFAKMGGLTELEGLKTWTPLLAILGSVAMVMTLILAKVMPLAG